MKLSPESQKLVDILNVYLEEINEELMNDEETLSMLYEKKNVSDEIRKKNAHSNVRYNAFTPRKNEVEESGEEQTELLNKIKAQEEICKVKKDKVSSIQNSIIKFMDSYEYMLTEYSDLKKELEEAKLESCDDKIEVKVEDKSEVENIKEDKEDTKENISRETIPSNDELKNKLNSVSNKLEGITYTCVYDYKKTSQEIKSVKSILDNIIDSI